MGIQPFNKFLKEMSNNAIRTQNRHMRPAEWVRYCSSLYRQMTTSERRSLQRRCIVFDNANPVQLPPITLRAEAMCIAMGLPLREVRSRFHLTPTHIGMRSRMLIIARHLGVNVFAPAEVKRRLAAITSRRLAVVEEKKAAAAYSKFSQSSTTKRALMQAANSLVSRKSGNAELSDKFIIEFLKSNPLAKKVVAKKAAPAKKVVAKKVVAKKAAPAKKVVAKK